MGLTLTPGSLDEAFKEPGRPFLLPAQLLWMALDAHHKLVTRELHALHQAVGRMCHGAQRRAKVTDRLVVESAGHMRSFRGRAYVSSLLPGKVAEEVVQ